jgi:predicted nucleic acid-binding protein
VIVTDASVVAEVLLQTPEAARIEERLFRSEETLHAPALLDVEVAHVMRRYVLRREMPEGRGAAAVRVLARFPIRRHVHEPLLERMWALRHSLTVYDAAYVALAEALGATLVTRDARLSSATGHRAVVELL